MHRLKRNIFIVGASLAAIVLATVTTMNTSTSLRQIGAANSKYSLDLNDTNLKIEGGYGDKTDLKLTRPGKSSITFGYVNGCGSNGNLGQFKSGKGYIYNIDAITNITSIMVTFTTGGNDKSAKLAVGVAEQPTQYKDIKSNTPYTFDGVDDYYFSIKSGGNALMIESIHIEYSCEKYITGGRPETGGQDQGSQDQEGETTATTTLTLKGGLNILPDAYGDVELPITASNKQKAKIRFKDAYENSNGKLLQLKNKSGVVYNTSGLNGLSKIDIAVNTNSVAITYGPSQNPNGNETIVKSSDGAQSITVPKGNPYFKLSYVNAYAQISYVTFTFESVLGSTTPVDPNPDIPGGGGNEGGQEQGGGDNTPTTPGSYDKPTEALTGYYQGFNIAATGATLLSNSRELMVSTHKKYTSYDDCRGSDAGGYYHLTDADPNKPGNIIDFYTHASIPEAWNSATLYNREHVWPQNLSGGNWGQSYGGSDLHHIRPDFKPVNGKRSNMKFGNVNGGTLYTFDYNGVTYPASHIGNNIWEPLDNVKGDVARIILYCFVHYNNATNLANNDNLNGTINSNSKVGNITLNNMPITNVIAGSTSQAFATLLQWHELDKVDELEINRNNEVYKIQGNRNIFIDQPWVVREIWG